MESIGFPTASANFRIRLATPSDYEDIISVLNDWWGGRQMSDMLPKLFFVHFRGTTFVLAVVYCEWIRQESNWVIYEDVTRVGLSYPRGVLRCHRSSPRVLTNACCVRVCWEST